MPSGASRVPLGHLSGQSWQPKGSKLKKGSSCTPILDTFLDHFGTQKGVQKGVKHRYLIWDHFWDPSGHNFGPLWDQFWTHFGTPLTSKSTPVDIAQTFKNHWKTKVFEGFWDVGGVQKTSKNGAAARPRRSRRRSTKMTPKWVQKRTQNGSKMGPKTKPKAVLKTDLFCWWKKPLRTVL